MPKFRIFVTALLACALAAPAADASPKAKKRQPRSTNILAQHIDLAIGLDAQTKGLVSQRQAAAARHATVGSLTPGSPYVAGSARRNSRGGFQNLSDPTEPNINRMREAELEVGMPLWLPGQRSALRDTVTSSVNEFSQRLDLRRLEVAGRIRDAWWNVQRTAREAAIARERLATAKEIEQDIGRQTQLGDTAPPDALLARNETLAAQTETIQAEAAAEAARLSYRTIVGADPPAGALEGVALSGDISSHPAIRVASAALERAEAQARLVRATFIENPEVGLFGRRETSSQGFTRADSTTVGFRFRMPLPTAGRNEPRAAEATAEVIRTQAELTQLNRIVAAEVAIARKAAVAARKAESSAGARLTVANQQYDIALKSIRLGEISAVDLFRVRQLRLDAQRSYAAAQVEAGLALSRLNQARGYAPGL